MNTMNQGQKEITDDELSVEIKNSGGARKSKLCISTDITSFPCEAYDNVETAWEVLERGCRLYGNNRCFGWRDIKSGYNWVTYSKFRERARNFGSGLINIGMSPGQKTSIGIYGKNSIEWLIAEYGCFSQSAVIIPIYDTFGPEATVKMIKQTELEIIICENESKARHILQKEAEIPTLKHIIVMHHVTEDLKLLGIEKNIHLHSFQDIEDSGKEKPVPLSPPVASDVYMVCFTSGTTGDPKGAELTHKYFVCSTCSVLLLFENEGILLTETDVMISYLPLAHIFEHLAEVLMLLVGASVGFFNGNVITLVEDMRVLQPTFFPAVPRLLNKLHDKAQDLFHPKCEPNPDIILQLENMDLVSTQETKLDPELYKPFKNMLGGKIRIVLSGSAQISKKVLNFYRTGLGYQVLEVYGQTECGPVSINVVKDKTIGTVGVPVPSCIIKLMDVPEMRYFAENNEGEICIKGHTFFKGYLKNPQKTAETIDSEGWLHTGDIGRFMPDGSLKIVDRLKHIFKLSLGEYIAPEKIEAIYSRSTYVSQVLIYGDSMKDYLVAIVVPEKDAVLPWVKENLKCETWIEACKNPILKKLILNDMKRLGKEAGLCSFEQAKAVHLHPELLTYEDGHLTPTFKTRRTVCKDFFKSEIDALYKITLVTK